jgi:hypothetical protein
MTETIAPTNNEVSLSEAFDLVLLSPQQASGILTKLAEQFSDSGPEVKEAFLQASQLVLQGSETKPA